MSSREFSDTVKLEVIKANLEKYNGQICCEVCGINLSSINECHFDHIHPFAKGGKSIFENCQLLCSGCNLKKNDKELKDFVLEEKAKSFLNGGALSDFEQPAVDNVSDAPNKQNDRMTKELFDKIIGAFIKRKGNISKVDFGREYNKLPSIHYVNLYYGGLNNLKMAFGIEDLSYCWNRNTIKDALVSFVAQHGNISQKDMIKANKLPSIPCVLNYYPEYKNFTDIKKGICNLNVPISWTKELAIEYGKIFADQYGRITQKDLRAENKLPSSSVISSLFGSLANYQLAVDTVITEINEYISKEEITEAVDQYFEGKERVIESQKVFYETFEISKSTVSKRYGTFAAFCEEQGIKVLACKKAKYTKREVDDIISKWIKEGNDIPRSHDLSKLGLPSRDVIRRFYEDWREPFVIYTKLYEEINRH
ncbi:MAG: HNH endonuclease [Clostridia bacterium]|nr:HNH endonuclease [Clostridia bacterium]